MKALPALVLVFAADALFAAPGLSSPEDIRAELTRQIPDCATVSENAARLLLQNPASTSVVVVEWHKFCGASREYRLFTIAGRLNEISAGSSEINEELWENLKSWSKGKTGMRTHPQMNALFRKTGEAAQPTSEEGKLLKIWFVTGYTPFIRAVGNAEKSRFYAFYRKDRMDIERGLSLAIAVNGTYWLPSGNLARIDPMPGIGLQMHMGFDNLFFGFLMDFRFGRTANAYNFYNENTGMLEQNSQFFGLMIGLDFKWAFLSFDQLSILAVGGLGYDLISHYSVPRYSRLKPAFSDSFNLNAGLGIRYYFHEDKTLFLESEFRIHRASFGTAGPGGDDLSGHYYTIFLTVGYKISFIKD